MNGNTRPEARVAASTRPGGSYSRGVEDLIAVARGDAEPDTVMEAFKPNEEPDDAYSVIGFTNDTGAFSTPDQIDGQRGLSAGRSVY